MGIKNISIHRCTREFYQTIKFKLKSRCIKNRFKIIHFLEKGLNNTNKNKEI